MSNGKDEQMVGTIKQAIEKTSVKNEEHWPGMVNQAVYGYGSRTVGNEPPPSFLMYGVHPGFCSADEDPLLESPFQV